jgi:hypothetical protein
MSLRFVIPPRDSGEGGPSVARSAKDGGWGAGLDAPRASTTKRRVRRPLHHASHGPPPPLRGGGCNAFPFPRAPAPRVLPINNVILLVTTGLDPVVYADLRQQG